MSVATKFSSFWVVVPFNVVDASVAILVERIIRVARDRFSVMKWSPGAPPASSSRESFVASSTPTRNTASASSCTA